MQLIRPLSLELFDRRTELSQCDVCYDVVDSNSCVGITEKEKETERSSLNVKHVNSQEREKIVY